MAATTGRVLLWSMWVSPSTGTPFWQCGACLVHAGTGPARLPGQPGDTPRPSRRTARRRKPRARLDRPRRYRAQHQRLCGSAAARQPSGIRSPAAGTGQKRCPPARPRTTRHRLDRQIVPGRDCQRSGATGCLWLTRNALRAAGWPAAGAVGVPESASTSPRGMPLPGLRLRLARSAKHDSADCRQHRLPLPA
jgi:hypothetical protein